MLDPTRNRPALLQLVAISWNFGWPVAAGVIVGHWLDDKLGLAPLLTLAFGLGAMITAAWRMVALGRRDAAERERSEHDEQRPGKNAR